MKLELTLLSLICLLFLFTRLYRIDSIPSSVYWDEASIGYNAYSIITTGADEWGKKFPVNFRAFGEFKLPVYIYSVALFEKFFNLTLAVRLPAVFFSLVSVFMAIGITFGLTKNKLISLLSGLLLVISPWFLIFSRVGYEANAGLAFFLIGIYLLSLDRKWFITIAGFSFILSIYSYNSFRVLVPIVTVYLGYLLRGKPRLYLLTFVALLTIGYLPIIHSYLTDSGSARFNTVSILNETQSKVELIKIFLANYFSHFSPNFLFFRGDSQTRMQIQGWGEVSIAMMPLLILGVIYIFIKKKKWLYFLLFWALISPLPAAITKESPHSLRSIALMPVLSIISALGCLFLFEKLNKISRYLVSGLVLVIVVNFILYFNTFLNFYNQLYSSDWQYSYSQVFTKYADQFNNYDHVIISDQYTQPYIFGLFYLKYPPEKFLNQKQLNRVNNWGFSTVSSFNKFSFGFKPNDLPAGNLLIFAGNQDKLSQNPIGIIRDLDNKPSLYIYEIKK